MNAIFDAAIESLGFSPTATAIAIRTIATCGWMRFRPDFRALIGVGLFQVAPAGDGYRFAASARMIRDGEMPVDIVDWLEDHLPVSGPLIGWDLDDIVQRLRAIADPRHRSILRLEENERLRGLPLSIPRTIKPGSASGLACNGCLNVENCVPALPTFALPPRELAEVQLAREAADAWTGWANCFGDFDDQDHPARNALRALDHVGGVRAVMPL